MQKRKKKELDGIDREILRAIYKRGSLVSRKIAEFVGLSPAAIAPRLFNLKDLGIIRESSVSGERVFRRKINGKKKLIRAPRSIYWEIDYKK